MFLGKNTDTCLYPLKGLWYLYYISTDGYVLII
jgi:hypothetical protein